MKNKDFYLAGRDAGVSKLTFSLLATIIGASSTIGLMGFAYSIGMPSILWLLFGSLGLVILSLSYSSFFLKNDSYTIAEFLGKKYGPGVRKITSWVIFLSWVGVIAAQFLALKKITEVFIPDISSIIVVFSVIIMLTLYTVIGGQKAVLFTDKMQLLFLVSGFLAINIFFIYKFDFNILSSNYEYLKFPINANFSFKDMVYLSFILIPVYFTGPDIHSRIFCSKDKMVIKRSLNIAALSLVPIVLLIVAPVITLYNVFGSIETNILSVFFKVLFEFKVLFYLFFISLAFALISSADTCLMTSATIFTQDILSKSKNSNIFYIRLIIISISVVAFLLSFYFDNIIDILKTSYTIYTSSVFIPFILIPLKDRLKLRNNTIFISMLISGTIGGISVFSGFKSGVLYAYLLSGLTISILSWLKR